VAYGLYKLLVPLSHPRWVGMRVGPADLALWSFLMASAHGAGLMLMPVLLRLQPDALNHGAHEGTAATVLAATAGKLALLDLVAIAVHTISMLVVMAVIALVVYQKVGLKILRSAWINLDRIWAGTLVVTGVVTILI
jgi:hypothetical protein